MSAPNPFEGIAQRNAALADMARLDQQTEAPLPETDRARELFEAYQRGQKDAFRIMRNFAGEKLEGE
jgi:hypothetical protein